MKQPQQPWQETSFTPLSQTKCSGERYKPQVRSGMGIPSGDWSLSKILIAVISGPVVLLLKQKNSRAELLLASTASAESTFCNLMLDVVSWCYIQREGAAEITGLHFGYLDLELHGYEPFRLGFSNGLM